MRLEAGAHSLGVLAGLLVLEVSTEGIGQAGREHITYAHVDDLDGIPFSSQGRTWIG